MLDSSRAVAAHPDAALAQQRPGHPAPQRAHVGGRGVIGRQRVPDQLRSAGPPDLHPTLPRAIGQPQSGRLPAHRPAALGGKPRHQLAEQQPGPGPPSARPSAVCAANPARTAIARTAVELQPGHSLQRDPQEVPAQSAQRHTSVHDDPQRHIDPQDAGLRRIQQPHRLGRQRLGPRLQRAVLVEGQIAALAASGLTNKAIGERLHLSARTVGGHLYNVFPKLGVTARAGLRDALTALTAQEDLPA